MGPVAREILYDVVMTARKIGGAALVVTLAVFVFRQLDGLTGYSLLEVFGGAVLGGLIGEAWYRWVQPINRFCWIFRLGSAGVERAAREAKAGS